MKKTFFSVNLLIMHTFAPMAIADVNSARQNELLYFVKHDCGSCHGMTLKGGLGPALLPQTLSSQPKDYLINTILEGRENTAMPPWKSMLTFDDASWIADQLQQGLIHDTQIAVNINNFGNDSSGNNSPGNNSSAKNNTAVNSTDIKNMDKP